MGRNVFHPGGVHQESGYEYTPTSAKETFYFPVINGRVLYSLEGEKGFNVLEFFNECISNEF